ncbi:hypothetical protein [Companilactobacillus metriopterae]|uniref:hypothetical protein n=1 Tax=Companilactobacillus metriopterae TaxID=1909267 RepID=UPI00100B3E7A|nr:hypothetical protein [Companilactobacillus metriopterae]
MEKDKDDYLTKFKRVQKIDEFGFDQELISKIGNQIVEIMKKEGITYEDAYACLQYSYNRIKFESNYLKLYED